MMPTNTRHGGGVGQLPGLTLVCSIARPLRLQQLQVTAYANGRCHIMVSTSAVL